MYLEGDFLYLKCNSQSLLFYVFAQKGSLVGKNEHKVLCISMIFYKKNKIVPNSFGGLE